MTMPDPDDGTIRDVGPDVAIRYCALPITPEPEIDVGANLLRTRAIIAHARKWVNRTVLHYYFFDGDDAGAHVTRADGTRQWRSWVGPADQRDVVRAAFREWKDVGIGIDFVEVAHRSEAELRIGFMPDDGSWAYIGTDALRIGQAERTMNFGWLLSGTSGRDTALHEVGHALGMPHEHQNPYAGIVWNEDAVYAALAAPPNRWTREKTHYNIIRKIPAAEVHGSDWDPDSIMHYPFAPGMIRVPERYATHRLQPAAGLSARDRNWARIFYPPQEHAATMELHDGRAQRLPDEPGAQADFLILPAATRRYTIATFGESDTVIVLFEKHDGTHRFLAGDDDSGRDRNARLTVRLRRGREYALRVRIKYAGEGPPLVMMW
jgi:hypothetical protein